LFSLAFGSIIGVACVTVLFVVAAYAKANSMFPVNGGEIASSLIALDSPWAFSVGWFLVMLYLGFTSFELISVGWIASVLFPAVQGPVLYFFLGSDVHLGQLLIGLVTCVLIWMLNVCGKSSAAWVQTVLAYGLLVFAGSILVQALLYGSAGHLEPWAASSDAGSPLAGNYGVFSMALLFYGGFNFASQSFGERAVAVTPRRITAAMFEAALVSRGLRDFVLVFGLIGLITSWNDSVFAASRLVVFLSDVHLLPAVVGKHHARYGTPVVAVASISMVTPLIALEGHGGIFAWLMTVVSVLRMRRTLAERVSPYRVRPALPVFAIAIVGTAFAVVETGWSFLVPGSCVPSVKDVIALGWAMLGYVLWLANARWRRSVSDRERMQSVLNSN
jgi:amino acid transporter